MDKRLTMTESAVADSWIVFDRIEIDRSGRRLFVNEAEVRLEPKAFAVLSLLAGNPGRAFTRDEILDAVWGHRHVTPGVLNRVITLIRQALGENGQDSQYLHTLHGVGYRLDAEVHFVAARHAANDAQAIEAIATAAASAATTAVFDPLPVASSQPTRVDTSSLAQISPATLTLPIEAAPLSPFSLKRPTSWLALGVLVLVIVASTLYWRAFKPHATTPTSPVLIVLPLHPVGNTQDEGILAEGLSEELITQLSRIDGLRLISSTSATRAEADNLDVAQLASRLNITHALEGSLRQSGDQLRIDLRLVETASGHMLWAQNYDRKQVDIFAIQREIAQSVAATLTLKLGLQTVVVDNDPALFREYLQIRQTLSTKKWGYDQQQVLDRLRAFVARAPNYAPAHGLLARALAKDLRPMASASLSEADRGEAAAEAARALALDPNQMEAHAALASLACRAAEWNGCFGEFQRVLALAPSNSSLRAAYASWLGSIGYLDEALRQAEMATSADPLNFEAVTLRARILDTLSRHDEAKRYLEIVAGLGPDYSRALTYANWFNAVWRGDFAAAAHFAAAMPADEGFRDAYLAVTRALTDASYWPQARPLIDASEAATGRDNFLRALDPNMDIPRIIQALDNTLRNRTSSYNWLIWMREYAALRRDDAFQDFLRRNHILDYWRERGWPPQCHAEGDRARCD